MQEAITTGARRLGQAAVRLLYPPQCVACEALVGDDFGLCPDCWRSTGFISGTVCDLCGTPLASAPGEEQPFCQDCMNCPRPWAAGRAAMMYRDTGRALVLALKHGDRLELARPAAQWLHRAARPLLRPGMLVVPVPLHRWRLWKRRYNQAALLSAGLARLAGLDHCPDALLRPHATGSQEGLDREARFARLSGAITAHPRRRAQLQEREVLLVDDVLTSGATLAAATHALLDAGAARVSVLALARVAKDA